jgi:PTH1 family peptidyl-tRNA hydrolase
MDNIIIGLGNPGKRYEFTRHNVGFITVDILAERHGIRMKKLKHRALVGEGVICGLHVLLVKPQTYMNLSGESAAAVMDYYKADPAALTVIYDDADISFGSIRIRKQGGSGTHNGMRSVIYHLNDDSFSRIRIGIGYNNVADLADHVLSGFQKDEVPVIERAILNAADAMECILREGVDMAMNKFNVPQSGNLQSE